MNPFEKVPIGHTGIQVTRLGLGGAPLSGMVLADGLFQGSPYDQGIQIVQRAYELGVRYFDTAPLYGEGRSEVRCGRVLSHQPRSSFALSTKVDRLLYLADPNDQSPYSQDGLPRYHIDFDFTPEGIRRCLEGSLQRLSLEAVDILYLHDSDFAGQHSDTTFAQGLETLVELRQEGVVKAIGMGMNQWELSSRMVARFDLDLILLAGRYTLLDQTALPQFLPLCLQRGVQLAIGGPFNSGILARDLSQPVTFDYRRAPREWVEKARRLKAICHQHKVDLRAAALQFPLAHPAVATTIPGASTLEELESNIHLIDAPIPPQLWSDIKTEGLLPTDAPTPT